MVKNVSILSQENLKDSIGRLFSSDDPGKKSIGIELEVFPLKKKGCQLDQLVELTSEQMTGLCDRLEQGAKNSNELFSTANEGGNARLSTLDGGLVTFEPGGQLEYSSAVWSSLSEAIGSVSKNINILHQIVRHEEIWFFHGGINPWHTVDEVGLKMKKPRYRAMDKHFASLGPFGQQMMRLTTALQLSLDLGVAETANRRWLAGTLLAPVMCAIFGNSPFAQGQLTGARSFRSIIWQNLDTSRTGFPHLSADRSSESNPEKQYLAYALNAKVILLPDSSGQLGFRENNVSFSKWLENGYNGFFPEKEDWETHLSLLFPEVRPKGFYEFRFVDGQSRAWWSVPAILITAILYDDAATEKVIDLLSSYHAELDKMLRNAAVAGVGAFPDLAKKIFEIGLKTEEFAIEKELLAYCERFYRNYTYRGINPADELLKLNSHTIFSVSHYLTYEADLLEQARPPAYALILDSLADTANNVGQPGENPCVKLKHDLNDKEDACSCC